MSINEYDYIITKTINITTSVTVTCWPTHKNADNKIDDASDLRIQFKYGVNIKKGGSLNFTDKHDQTHASKMWGHTVLVRDPSLGSFFTLYRGGSLTINGHNQYAMEINGYAANSKNVTKDTPSAIRLDNTDGNGNENDALADSVLNVYDVQFVDNHTLGNRSPNIQVSKGAADCKTRYNITVQRSAFLNSYSAAGSIALFHNYTAGTAKFEWCIFAHNVSSGHINKATEEASSYGGGIRTYGRANAQITVNRCVFYQNKTGYIRKLTVDTSKEPDKITAVTDTENTTDTCMGAALYFNAGGQDSKITESLLTIKDCQFIGNRANTAGGAIYCESRIVFTSNTDVGTNYNFVKHPIVNDNYNPNSGYRDTFSDVYLARNPDGIANSLAEFLRGTYIVENVTTANANTSNTAVDIRGLGGGIAQATYSNEGVTVYTDNEITLSNGVYLEKNKAVYGGGYGMLVRYSDSFPEGRSFKLTCNGATITDNTATDGGGIYICCKSEKYPTVLNINSGLISYNEASSDGGGIYLENATNKSDHLTLTFLNGSVNSNTAGAWGGGIYVVKANMNIGTGTGHTINIVDNTANDTGGGIMAHHSNIYLGTGGTNTINITDNTAALRGGGVAVYQNINDTGTYTFQLANGNILRNKVTSTNAGIVPNAHGGGGVWVHTVQNSITTLTGATISDNEAKTYGAGVYAYTGGNAQFVIEEGTISHNTSQIDGGGLYIFSANNGKTTISGGTIGGDSVEKGNIAHGNGGGVYLRLRDFGKAEITGGDIIYNTATGTNFETGGGGIFAIFAHDEGAAVNSEFVFSGGSIANNTTANSGGGMCIISNSTKGNVQITGGSVTNNSASSDGGGIYLKHIDFTFAGGDISQNTAARFGGGVCIGINEGDANKSVFNFSEGTISYNHADNGIDDPEEGTEYGGGIFANDVTVNISGNSKILNNIAAKLGGGIYVQDNSILDITGGELKDNRAEGGGGGSRHVCGGGIAASGSQVILHDGCIVENNYSEEVGGGIYIYSSASVALPEGQYHFNMQGGSIKNNSAELNGGGLYISINAKAVFTNGVIKENKALNFDGGGVYVSNGSSVDLQGAQVMLNTADRNGGGIFVQVNSEINITNGTITQNTATQSGGGLYINDSTGTISNGKIDKNSAGISGGGLVISGNSSFIVEGDGSISYNTASRSGGGIYISGGTVDMLGGLITYNKAEGDFNTVNNTAALPAGVPMVNGQPTSLGYADSSSNGSGVGGGIYLEKGSFYMRADNNPDTASTVGIYGNLATFAADDVYASGNGTDVVLPDITGMELTGLEGTEVTGWYMDYIPNDGYYPQYLLLSPGDPDRNQGRYRSTTNVDQRVDYPGSGITGNNGKMYLNLTLGSSANMTITKTIPNTNTQPDSDFIYKITLPNNSGIMYVTLTSDMFEPVGNNMVASVTLTNVVEGQYIIEELQSWSWRYSCTNSNATNAEDAAYSQDYDTVTFTLKKKGEELYFVNERDKLYWLDGKAFKPNLFDKFHA